jgi:crotonobetainyl-CoA:carnitine CoA-transferase CaiB-like acyl-CoA transferase
MELTMAGVFSGVRVLDLSRGIAGPMTTMHLADGGAEVTRIESPHRDTLCSTGHRVWNRGKKSAVLDLTLPAGRAAFARLASRADVVVEDFAPGQAGRLEVDHATTSLINPGIITCSITGYGKDGEHASRPGYDGLVAARTGLLFDHRGRTGTSMDYIMGRDAPLVEFDVPDGLRRGADRSGPLFPRSTWPSIGASYLATLGVAAALRAREHVGRGQWVETSLLQGALAAVCLNWQRVERPDEPMYWMWPVDRRSIEGLYECSDGRWVHHWTVRPKWVLGASEGTTLVANPLDTSYRDDPDRIPMDPDGMLTGMVLHPLLAEAFAKFPSAEWVKAAAEAGIGVALVRSPTEALSDPAFLADGCVVEIEDPVHGTIRCVGPTLEFSATPSAVRGPAPLPGQHTEEVLDEAAMAGPAPRTPTTPPVALAHPLSGVRVLDLGLGVAGPFAGRMLADLGAEVIKITAPLDKYWAATHMGLGTNRGKRSIALNLKDPRGRAVLDRMLERADVVTTNWRPGAAARLGLDFDTLHARFPRLIFCNTRGYEKGERSELPGTDQTAAALTGTEWEDGACDAGNPPLWSRSNMGDTGNALLASIAITAALYHRDRTGEGQAVSTSIVNAGLLHTSYAWIPAAGDAPDWGCVDAGQYGLSPYYRLYRCSDDRWLFVAAMTGEQRRSLAITTGVDEQLVHEPTKAEIDLESAIGSREASVWFELLDAAGVPVEIADETFCRTLFHDPAALAAGLISETHSAAVGRFVDPGLLVNFGETPGVIQRGPCASGEHTRDIMLELGFSDAEVDDYAAAGSVVEALDGPSA